MSSHKRLLRFITARGLSQVRSQVHRAYATDQYRVSVPVLPMLALLMLVDEDYDTGPVLCDNQACQLPAVCTRENAPLCAECAVAFVRE